MNLVLTHSPTSLIQFHTKSPRFFQIYIHTLFPLRKDKPSSRISKLPNSTMEASCECIKVYPPSASPTTHYSATHPPPPGHHPRRPPYRHRRNPPRPQHLHRRQPHQPARHHRPLFRHLRPTPPQQQAHRRRLRQERRVPRLPARLLQRRPRPAQARRHPDPRRRVQAVVAREIHRPPRAGAGVSAVDGTPQGGADE